MTINDGGITMTGFKPVPFVGVDDDWTLRALCAEVDPELWFPEKGQSTADAKRICAACEVRTQCLEYALDRRERYGVYGGKSERERRRILAERGVVLEDAA